MFDHLPYYDHHYQQGRYLPLSWFDPPTRPPTLEEVRWLLRPPFDLYVIDVWRRLIRLPFIDSRNRYRPTAIIKKQVKNGSIGFMIRRRDKPYWISTRQLRIHLIKL